MNYDINNPQFMIVIVPDMTVYGNVHDSVTVRRVGSRFYYIVSNFKIGQNIMDIPDSVEVLQAPLTLPLVGSHHAIIPVTQANLSGCPRYRRGRTPWRFP